MDAAAASSRMMCMNRKSIVLTLTLLAVLAFVARLGADIHFKAWKSPSAMEHKPIAQALVNRQLAACVNIVPQIESVYRWRGEVETAAECLLVIKTTVEALDRLRAALSELHSYELPEQIEIAIEDGSEAYLKWIGESVGGF